MTLVLAPIGYNPCSSSRYRVEEADTVIQNHTMRRRRLILLLGFSIPVLCTLWIRGYYVGDSVRMWCGIGSQKTFEAGFHQEKGIVEINAGVSSRSSQPVLGISHYSGLPGKWPRENKRWFAIGPGRLTFNPPYWLVVSSITILLAARVYYVHRRQKRTGGRACASCGYDIRASFDRCPECGAAIPTPLPEGRQ